MRTANGVILDTHYSWKKGISMHAFYYVSRNNNDNLGKNAWLMDFRFSTRNVYFCAMACLQRQFSFDCHRIKWQSKLRSIFLLPSKHNFACAPATEDPSHSTLTSTQVSLCCPKKGSSSSATKNTCAPWVFGTPEDSFFYLLVLFHCL